MQENVIIQNMRLQELNPVQCGREACEPCHSYGPAVRDFYLLHYVVSGKGKFITQEITYSLGKGDVFVIRPFEMTYYEANEKEPWEYIWIGFTANISLPNALKKDVVKISNAEHYFNAMFSARHMKFGREMFICGCIWQVLGKMFENEADLKSNPNHIVDLAISCIESEYMHEFSVIKLANRLHLDRSYFSTLFRTRTGQSPQQYLTKVRLTKAIELMTVYGYNASEAALSVGYPDVFSFSKMFKKHYKTSPTAYCGKF